MNLKDLLSKDKKNILICPSSYNEGYFKEAEGEFLFDLSFMNPADFINNILGAYVDNAIIYLNKECGHTVSGAKTLLSDIHFYGDTEKTKELLKDYYVLNEGYIEYLKDKNIIYLISELSDPLFELALNKLTNYGIEAKKLDFNKAQNNHIYFKEYRDIISEAEGVIEKIASLIKDGTDINKIKIHISSDEYYEILKDVFSYYTIPYTSLKKMSLIETKEGIEFFNEAKNWPDEVLDDNEKAIEKLDEYRFDNKMSDSLYQSLLKLFDGVDSITVDYLRDFLTNNYVKQIKYKDSIEFGNVFDRFMPSDTHLFIIGAVQGQFPKPIVVSGLLTDKKLIKNNVPTSKELNTLKEDYYLSKISSIDNVYITYNLQGFDKKHSRPTFLDKISNIEEMKESDLAFSAMRDYLKYSKAKEIYDNYGIVTDNLEKYYTHGIFTSKKIKDYNPIFKLNVDGDDDFELIKKFLNNTLKLSYTSLTNYYECPTKYFLSKVINIDPFETNYSNFIGSFFHEFIEKFIDKEYDEAEVEKLFRDFSQKEKAKSGYEMSFDELFYFKIFYNCLPKIHETLRNYRADSTFNIFGTEYRFNHKIEDDRMNVYITGSIDLVLKDDNDNYLVADYKTGHKVKVDIDNGLGMQLFIYFNMLKKDNDNAKPFGLAYQYIPRFEEEANKDIKFNGFFIDDTRLKNDFSGDYKNIYSNSIKREREDLNNLSKTAQIENALKTIDEKINEAKDRILSLDFQQTPSNNSCKFCNFKEICYKSQINEEDDEEEDETDE